MIGELRDSLIHEFEDVQICQGIANISGLRPYGQCELHDSAPCVDDRAFVARQVHDEFLVSDEDEFSEIFSDSSDSGDYYALSGSGSESGAADAASAAASGVPNFMEIVPWDSDFSDDFSLDHDDAGEE
jgi:hypothetical protein